jgi:uncharacterized alkaline shock family protein YloU
MNAPPAGPPTTSGSSPRHSADAVTDPNLPVVGADVLDPVETRGRTTIEDRVIETMAARITTEEPGVGGAARRVLGVAVTGEDSERAPQVEATIAGDVVSLRVRLSVTYPAPVNAVTDRVRRRLIDRISELTGKRVRMVDVDVAAVHRPAMPERVIR